MSKIAKVSRILEVANEHLAREDETATQDFKKGICVMLERILMDTNNYEGFNFLPWMNGGFQAWLNAGEPETKEKDEFAHNGDRDYYSRMYYKSKTL